MRLVKATLTLLNWFHMSLDVVLSRISISSLSLWEAARWLWEWRMLSSVNFDQESGRERLNGGRGWKQLAKKWTWIYMWRSDVILWLSSKKLNGDVTRSNRTSWFYSRRVESIDPSVVADSIRGVSQVMTPVVYPLSCYFVIYVSFQFMLGCSVRPKEPTQINERGDRILHVVIYITLAWLTPAEQWLCPDDAAFFPDMT